MTVRKSPSPEAERQLNDAAAFVQAYCRAGLGDIGEKTFTVVSETQGEWVKRVIREFPGYRLEHHDYGLGMSESFDLRLSTYSQAYPGYILELEDRVDTRLGILRYVTLLERFTRAEHVSFTSITENREVLRERWGYEVRMFPHPRIDKEVCGHIRIPPQFYPLEYTMGLEADRLGISHNRMPVPAERLEVAINTAFRFRFSYNSTTPAVGLMRALPAHVPQLKE